MRQEMQTKQSESTAGMNDDDLDELHSKLQDSTGYYW